MSYAQNIPASPPLIGKILEASGKVLLKRDGWPRYQPTSVGCELYVGDLLQPEVGAKVLVQCADGRTVWSVPAGTISGATNGCPPQPISIPRPSNIIPPRRCINPLIPYIISPRRTLLIDRIPLLNWNPVPNATRYTVSLMGDDEVIWSAESIEPPLLYSGQPLEPEIDYLLIVKADTGAASRDEELPDLGFRLLGEAESLAVREAVGELTQLERSETQVVALANLYGNYNLKAEAIAILTASKKRGDRRAVVEKMLGDLYREIELHRLAIVHYLEAFELASEIDDLEAKARIAESLGRTYEAIANPTEASRWLERARNYYERLENS